MQLKSVALMLACTTFNPAFAGPVSNSISPSSASATGTTGSTFNIISSWGTIMTNTYSGSGSTSDYEVAYAGTDDNTLTITNEHCYCALDGTTCSNLLEANYPMDPAMVTPSTYPTCETGSTGSMCCDNCCQQGCHQYWLNNIIVNNISAFPAIRLVDDDSFNVSLSTALDGLYYGTTAPASFSPQG